MRNAIQLFTLIVAGHVQSQEGLVASISGVDRATRTWIPDFLNLDPRSFTRSDAYEDPQDLIDQIKHTFNIIYVISKESLEIATYRLKGVFILWYEAWKGSTGKDAPSFMWKEFKVAFLDHCLPLEFQEVCADQF